MVHALGWTWSQAEAELDLHRLAALNRHWHHHPPVYRLVAAYLDYKPPEPAIRIDSNTEISGDLAAALETLPARVGGHKVDRTAWERFKQGQQP